MSDGSIVDVRARRVFDSRGRPTIEADVVLDHGVLGRQSRRRCASRGSREAIDLRDGGARFGGFDVMNAIGGVNGPIRAALRGIDATDQQRVDATLAALDGTPNKSRLGGNAMVAVSLAVAHAAAAARRIPLWKHLAGDDMVRLPLPEIQIFGGGAHASRQLDLQDLMIMPVGAATFADAIAMVAEVYRAAAS